VLETKNLLKQILILKDGVSILNSIFLTLNKIYICEDQISILFM